MYSVKEVAEIFGVSVHTIRFYDDCGLIPSVIRDNSKNRKFTDESLEWIFICITLRKTGLSIKDVKNYVDLFQKGESTLKERFNLMIRQKNKILSEIEDLKKSLQLIEKKSIITANCLTEKKFSGITILFKK